MNAIGWVNQISGLEPIAHSPLVRATLVSLRRNLAKPKAKKEPVTVEMLATLLQSLGSLPSLSELRLTASCLLAFASSLCYDEMARLRCCDTTILDGAMRVCNLSSKTDQYRQGDTVLVARNTYSLKYLVSMMEK